MTKTALVIGAGGAVGEAIAHELLAHGWRVAASMRTRREEAIARLRRAGAEIAFHDIARDASWTAQRYDAIVFATHLPLALAALENSDIGAAHVVAFSSNNVAIHPEAPAYRELARAEAALRTQMSDAAIVRPTMIYGDPRLRTLARLLAWARRSPVLPLPGSGKARVQPVFHEDLGRLAAGLAERRAAGVFAAGGPDVVSMRDLFEAAAYAAGARRMILPIPTPLLRIAAPLTSPFGFSAAQAARADVDRLVAPQTPVPDALMPRVGLAEGLARLAAALGLSGGSPAGGR